MLVSLAVAVVVHLTSALAVVKIISILEMVHLLVLPNAPIPSHCAQWPRTGSISLR